jgi:hypothetical protein
MNECQALSIAERSNNADAQSVSSLDSSMIETRGHRKLIGRWSFLASVVGKRDDGMLGNVLTPDRWGSATEGWRKKLIALDIGLVLEFVKRAISLHWPAKITCRSPLSDAVPSIRLGFTNER